MDSISSFSKRARLPVGVPRNGNRLVVRNAGGNELPLGFLGEICIEVSNPMSPSFFWVALNTDKLIYLYVGPMCSIGIS